MSWLSVSGITLQERGNTVLEDISFSQRQFQKLAIAGETGAGKSTLLQIIAGLTQPTTGTVRFEDRRVKGPVEVLIPGHPGIAFLSQHFELPPSLRVEQVLRYASKQQTVTTEQLYNLCRIGHLATRRTDQLSGGERQRIALARLLLTAPRLLLLDEPFSNLDRGHRQILKAVIHDIGAQLGITCLLISHDPADTLSWAEQILVIQSGRLVQQGPPALIYRQPVNEYTAGLFGDYNLLQGPVAGGLAAGAGLPRRRKPLLLRPENVLLGPEGGEAGLPATVQEVRFFGSYSEVDVRLQNTTIRVKTTATHQVGQAVTVAVAPENFWYL
ncbi:ABC transporter ATP-binding protein [Hymenobacter chitinivorans]|uniref:Iron(III) transport system ATP-binding protein n=1 Tax=Hymenobacter chitinivorans DSM 11115 TaxID=1121954 RepID=A0A2M9B958_9BACT|nr:ABC transporter ATP-binding protein [Hymenobacter chitinivorans]PJJ54447.1 iron(III) transport system ATP-binding protein [Hymenobacter chitinivorans DSM 11115]